MNCIRCGKVLLRPAAAALNTAAGPVGWGPKCAVHAGLIRRKPRRAAAFKARRGKPAQGPAQMDWVDQLAAVA